VRQGKHVLVATPTASGKSLIYNLPVFEGCINDQKCHALYLFPLKALAQDQLRGINKFAAYLPEELRPTAAIIDGDTKQYQRRKLRQTPPNILISNPDMLHLSLLGYHRQWAHLWPDLRYIILDEIHTYRGVFGSHMAWVMRRLRRICRHYGSEPVFILSSATIGNPEELGRDLLGVDVKVINKSGAPRSKQHFIFLNPMDSAFNAATILLQSAVKRFLRTIVYTQSRKAAELISLWAQARLKEDSTRLSPYRAGFLPEERRQIEQQLSSGELLAVVSTSALELGIDIGELDICLLVGYPGTVMTTWQRGGRVGRRQRQSLIVLIAQEDALDQHFMRDPEDFFNRQVEAAVLNPANPIIAAQHILCAAAESPINVAELDEKEYLQGTLHRPDGIKGVIDALVAKGELLMSADGRRYISSRKYPHRNVNLRGGGNVFRIYQDKDHTLLGEIDYYRCLRECHPGAVYLHRGRTWLCASLDIEAREVTVVGGKVPYFTRPLADKETEILKVYEQKKVGCCTVSLGYLRVTDRVTGFQKRLVRGQKLIASESLDLPPLIFETEGLWLEIPHWLQEETEQEQMHFMGGIHALEHAAIGVFPLLVLCDRNDIGGISQPDHPQLERAAVFIYDGQPGGRRYLSAGIS